MCNEYRPPSAQQLADTFKVVDPTGAGYQGALFPGLDAPVVRGMANPRDLLLMAWGFERPFSKRPLNNARVEKLWTAPTWSPAMKAGRRCLLPAVGFCEWHHVEPGVKGTKKIKHLLTVDGGAPFAIAGLWEEAQGGPRVTMVIGEPNDLVAAVHNAKPAMPVILDASAWDQWCDPDAGKYGLQSLLNVPFPAERMAAEKI